MSHMDRITPAAARCGLVASQPVALSPMAAHMALLKRSRVPELSEDELEEMRSYELRTGKEWGL